MNKRLRRKLHKGEFIEYGFMLHITLRPDLDESALDKWWDDFIPFIESVELSVGGGGHCEHEYFVTYSPRRRDGSRKPKWRRGRPQSATEAHRALVQEWLERDKRVDRFTVGGPVDAWVDELSVAPTS